MIHLIQLDSLLVLSLLALGVAYVITGSQIGYPVRVIWWILTHRIHLDTLAFCPACNAWWGGGVLALLTGHSWVEALQAAFGACGVAAVAQGVAGLAAADKGDIQARFGGRHGEQS